MKKILKVIFGIIFSVIAINLYSEVNAATATISANKTSAVVGDSVKVTVNINAAAWNIKVSGSASDSIVGYNADCENQKTTKTYTIDTSKEGTYKVYISGDITDASDEFKKIDNNISINVQPKKETESKSTDTAKTTTTEKTTTSTNKKTTTSTTKTTTSTNKENNSKNKTDTKTEEIKEQEKNEEVIEEYLLESLKIEDVTLAPEFNKDIFEYEVVVEDKQKLEIEAKPIRDNIIVEIMGNEELNIGENTIIINLKGQDDKEITTYKIKVINNKSDLTIAQEKINSLYLINNILVCSIIVLVICIIIINILYINKIKKIEK